MKIRILTDEDGNILAFAKTGGVEWQEIDVKDEDWQGVLDKQSEGEVMFYNPKSKKLETIALGQFEELVDGIAVYKKEKEVDYNNNQLTYLRKRYTELKVAKADSEELGLDTTDIVTEIAELKLKVVSTQAKIAELKLKVVKTQAK